MKFLASAGKDEHMKIVLFEEIIAKYIGKGAVAVANEIEQVVNIYEFVRQNQIILNSQLPN